MSSTKNRSGARLGINLSETKGVSLVAELMFMHVCEHAYLDSRFRPCLVGIFVDLVLREFPMSIPMLTIALGIYAEPRATIHIRVELGPPGQKALRWANFEVPTSPEGLAFLPCQLHNLFFVEPQTVEVRVIDTHKNNEFIGSRSIIVRRDVSTKA
jgi:hypothetical protein